MHLSPGKACGNFYDIYIIFGEVSTTSFFFVFHMFITFLLTGSEADILSYRLMVELRHLIRQSAQRQEAPSRRLCALLSALSDCVGSLNEKKHRDLFEAILEVRLQLYATVT